ncbi:MAG: hypothetical protein FWG55_01390 [Candidatus Bathyarchaeota archaeon]|nr:hypothetical protein [Candidatus Termiticorpusculum sp.]
MSSFPRSPRLLKGAIVCLDSSIAVPKYIIFQYNPDTISRTVTAKYSKTSEGTESLRFGGAPTEDISVDLEFDATDYLEHPDVNPVAVKQGITPQLAALESLLYPSSSQVIANEKLAAAGKMEIVPPMGPLTLFVFGANKVLPVKITKCAITEQAYDTNLNPIQAKVSLTMSVLTYSDLQHSKTGYSLYLANHVGKEVLSQFVVLNSDAGTGFIR